MNAMKLAQKGALALASYMEFCLGSEARPDFRFESPGAPGIISVMKLPQEQLDRIKDFQSELTCREDQRQWDLFLTAARSGIESVLLMEHLLEEQEFEGSDGFEGYSDPDDYLD